MIQRNIKRITSWGALGALALLVACVSAKPPPRPVDLPFTKVFSTSFETVWGATTQVLDIYSIAKIDRDAGLIETDWLEFRHNRALYENPDQKEFLESIRYRLKIKLSKGIVAQTGEPATRVQVSKELQEHKGFFIDWDRVPTDEIEEKVILYRIDQRIKITEAIKRKSVGSKAAG